MNVGLEIIFGVRESDFLFIVIFDSSCCIGMFIFYKNNYKIFVFCFGIEGVSGLIMSYCCLDVYLFK